MELLLKIMSRVQPSTIVDLAVTSKYIYEVRENAALKLHRANITKYYKVSDRHSRTVPQVLEDILLELDLAWCIKRLVSYNDQKGWPD